MTLRQHSILAGSGVAGERALLVPSAARIRIGGDLCAQLALGHVASHVLSVRGDDNIVPHVSARVRGGVLEIALAAGAYQPRCPLIVSGTWAALSELYACGGARVRVRGLGGTSVALIGSGASTIDADGSARSWRLASDGHARLRLMAAGADDISLAARGNSAVELRGAARVLRIDARATTRVEATAPGLEARSVRVDLAGAASARVSAADGVSGRVRAPALLRVCCSGTIDIAGSYRREWRTTDN
jgi:hypothetical protein